MRLAAESAPLKFISLVLGEMNAALGTFDHFFVIRIRLAARAGYRCTQPPSVNHIDQYKQNEPFQHLTSSRRRNHINTVPGNRIRDMKLMMVTGASPDRPDGARSATTRVLREEKSAAMLCEVFRFLRVGVFF